MSRQTSSLLRALDCFAQGIMLVDTSTNDWSIIFVNDAWVTVTGHTTGEGPGRGPLAAVPPVPGGRWGEQVLQLLNVSCSTQDTREQS